VDAFDADVLIYAAVPDHPLGTPVRALLQRDENHIGSVLLVPEILTKPLRDGAPSELDELSAILGRLTLLTCDRATAQLAAALGASYGLRAADSIHLATAVQAGADRFITNNRRHFRATIAEVDVVYPDQLSA
jgi:predicted nucleic acid-binding protein